MAPDGGAAHVGPLHGFGNIGRRRASSASRRREHVLKKSCVALLAVDASSARSGPTSTHATFASMDMLRSQVGLLPGPILATSGRCPPLASPERTLHETL